MYHEKKPQSSLRETLSGERKDKKLKDVVCEDTDHGEGKINLVRIDKLNYFERINQG